MRLRVRWPWVAVVALGARVIVLTPKDTQTSWARILYVAALATLALWALVQTPAIPRMWIVSVGVFLNLVVIAANAGRMPVDPRFVNGAIQGPYVSFHDPSAYLIWLGDGISLFGLVYSAGDLITMAGLAIVSYEIVRLRDV